MKMILKLRYLILLVALLSILVTFVSSIISVNKMNKKNLIESTLETNYVYSEKLSNTVDVFFHMVTQTLKYSADVLATEIEKPNNYDFLIEEAERLKLQTNVLNSIVIANADGQVLATSPQTLDLVGEILNSKGGQEAITKRVPLVSKPYEGISGRLIIFISHPIFSSEGEYLGLVGGSIYLLEDNFLDELLGEYYYKDGSYVYVVDADGRIIYHEDETRINDLVNTNPVVMDLMAGNSGTQEVINSKKVDMLAGYAYNETTGWGIVAQRPKAVTLAPNTKMINEMVLNILPSLVLSIILVIIISQIIALPLQRLSLLTETSTKKNQNDKIGRVKAWYYEAIQLKKALTFSMNFFHEKVDHITAESHTDPLTGLRNRRTMDSMLSDLVQEKKPFVLVIVDIDYFKKVNDTFGHAVGDLVLTYLANTMKEVVNAKGMCFRYGGEEFVLLLPNLTRLEGYELTEQLRIKVSQETSPTGHSITVSSGLVAYEEDADNIVDLFNLADKRLYEAKSRGRNQTNDGNRTK